MIIELKTYITSFFQGNIPNILIIRPPARSAHDRVCTKQLQNKSVQKIFENSWGSYKNIFNTAKMIRKDNLAENMWNTNAFYTIINAMQLRTSPRFFTKYLFAHDQLNYTRHSPMYLINMVQLRRDNKQSWFYLKGNYIVSRTRKKRN